MLNLPFKKFIWIALSVLLAQLSFSDVSYALPKDLYSLPTEALPSELRQEMAAPSPEVIKPKISQNIAPPISQNVAPPPERLNNATIDSKTLIDSFLTDHRNAANADREYNMDSINRFNDQLYGTVNN